MTIWKNDLLDPIGLNPLHCSVSEQGLFIPFIVNKLQSSIWKCNFFLSIAKVLLDLPIGKLKDLASILESRLGGVGLCEEVHDFQLARECLLDVFVVKEHNHVSIRPYFFLHSIRKLDLLTARFKLCNNFPIIADVIAGNLEVLRCIIVIGIRELQVVLVWGQSRELVLKVDLSRG